MTALTLFESSDQKLSVEEEVHKGVLVKEQINSFKLRYFLIKYNLTGKKRVSFCSSAELLQLRLSSCCNQDTLILPKHQSLMELKSFIPDR